MSAFHFLINSAFLCPLKRAASFHLKSVIQPGRNMTAILFNVRINFIKEKLFTLLLFEILVNVVSWNLTTSSWHRLPV